MPARAKVTIVGAGNVGATCAHWLAVRDVADIVLADVVEGMPQGKALDLAQSGPIEGFDVAIIGTNDYADTADSDVVVVTAGLARKPGMSRDELLAANTKIVKSCTQQLVKYSPGAIVVVVSNPLDAMVYTAYRVSGLAPRRIVGQAGVLDVARYKTFVAREIGCSVQDVSALLIGGHGDEMVPLPRYSSVGGIPVTDLIGPDRMDSIVHRTRKAGGEIVALLKTGSAYYTPAAAAARMVESVIRDQKRVMPCAAWCEREYDIGGCFVGVPCMLGADGVENVFELALTDTERSAFEESIKHVRELCARVDKLLCDS